MTPLAHTRGQWLSWQPTTWQPPILFIFYESTFSKMGTCRGWRHTLQDGHHIWGVHASCRGIPTKTTQCIKQLQRPFGRSTSIRKWTLGSILLYGRLGLCSMDHELRPQSEANWQHAGIGSHEWNLFVCKYYCDSQKFSWNLHPFPFTITVPYWARLIPSWLDPSGRLLRWQLRGKVSMVMEPWWQKRLSSSAIIPLNASRNIFQTQHSRTGVNISLGRCLPMNWRPNASMAKFGWKSGGGRCRSDLFDSFHLKAIL